MSKIGGLIFWKIRRNLETVGLVLRQDRNISHNMTFFTVESEVFTQSDDLFPHSLRQSEANCPLAFCANTAQV